MDARSVGLPLPSLAAPPMMATCPLSSVVADAAYRAAARAGPVVMLSEDGSKISDDANGLVPSNPPTTRTRPSLRTDIACLVREEERVPAKLKFPLDGS